VDREVAFTGTFKEAADYERKIRKLYLEIAPNLG